MALVGFEDLREIHADARFLVVAARRSVDGAAVVLKSARRGSPDRERLGQRVRGEYELLRSLRAPGVVATLGLVTDDGEGGAPVLVLEDAGPETLRQWLRGKPVPLELFLELALSITEVVGRVHARGVVHGDLQPDN